MLKTAIIKTSYKENEHRIPIYPEHLSWISEKIRKNLWFESGYGEGYGYSDKFFVKMAAGVMSRKDVFAMADLIILPKPISRDLCEMKNGQILWGWAHCVQQKWITQAAIDRRLTILAWEAMHSWGPNGEKLLHVFHKNNELAGYAAIHHALQLTGQDGYYGPRRQVVVFGYGSVSRGAIHALHGRGFNNILVLTRRPSHLVRDQHPDCYYAQIVIGEDDRISLLEQSGASTPLIDVLSRADIIYNGVLQDIKRPLMFVKDKEVLSLKATSLIIDVSCDEGMGFPFARPTTFEDPVFKIGNNITYYAVDHTPAYLWKAASREISRALIPYLDSVLGGRGSWEHNKTVQRAIEIDAGVVQNEDIIRFQNRANSYPHATH